MYLELAACALSNSQLLDLHTKHNIYVQLELGAGL